jgi:POT family proton-dependent oligopeptide transporter
MADPASPAVSPHDKSFFGHPRGLSTLFFTEMWERFSYYGMRALLLLYMTAPLSAGGMELDTATGGAIYGLYTSMVYMATLPGGWIADRLVGQRAAVLYGGILIACGHFSMAVPSTSTFYLGLFLIVIGTGLLKGNVSVIVGALYGKDDIRRDAGFSIFYMGINLGAFIAPLVCGYLGQKVSWHAGFAAAGFGMLIGVIQYVLGAGYLGEAGRNPAPAESPEAARRLRLRTSIVAIVLVAAVVSFAVMSYTGALGITPKQVSDAAGYGLLVLTVAFFAWLFLTPGWTPEERNHLYAIVVLFLAAALFWSLFEQAGSTLNLFADRDTRTTFLGWGYPSSWFQSVNSLFVWTCAPLFAWLWIRLGRRQPSTPVKFALGLILVGAGFAVLVVAARLAQNGVQVSPMWLIVTYLLHTCGELCLSPVGLSAMTKLAPVRIGGLMMGVWFLASSVGNFMAGRVSGFYESMPLPSLFTTVAMFGIVAGLVMLALSPPIKRMMGEVN